MENNEYLKLACSPPLLAAEKICCYFDLDPACFQRYAPFCRSLVHNKSLKNMTSAANNLVFFWHSGDFSVNWSFL